MKERVKVAYLGPQGTFSQAAALNHFEYDCDLHDCDSIDDVFSVVASSEVDYGVVPVENSTEGAVNNTQDCLIDSTVQIVGEVIRPGTYTVQNNGENVKMNNTNEQLRSIQSKS